MFTCIVCHFDVPLDDTVVLRKDGRCLCLRCVHREAGTTLVMPRKYRQQIISCLAEVA
jgi:hypothetical protein